MVCLINVILKLVVFYNGCVINDMLKVNVFYYILMLNCSR